VMSLVHRRCGDAKAAVRRGALQLLEALLVMRASWQAYPRQLPSTADLSLLEAATTDPLVRASVGAGACVWGGGLLLCCVAVPSHARELQYRLLCDEGQHHQKEVAGAAAICLSQHATYHTLVMHRGGLHCR
jgi:hypothetical protein